MWVRDGERRLQAKNALDQFGPDDGRMARGKRKRGIQTGDATEVASGRAAPSSSNTTGIIRSAR